MFMVDESTAEAIRHAYHEGGEFAAAIELRRFFPGITDNENARRCARAIAGWSPRSPTASPPVTPPPDEPPKAPAAKKLRPRSKKTT